MSDSYPQCPGLLCPGEEQEKPKEPESSRKQAEKSSPLCAPPAWWLSQDSGRLGADLGHKLRPVSDGLVVMSTYCSHRGPEFGSPHPYLVAHTSNFSGFHASGLREHRTLRHSHT